MSNKVVKLEQWKMRAQISTVATSLGWDVKKMDLADIKEPAMFYICEPLQTGFNSISAFNYRDLVKLVKEGTKKYASSKVIFDHVATLTMEVINDNKSGDSELMRLMFFGNLLNYASTKTAEAVIKSKDMFRHFGVVIYDNPHRQDGVEISIRPIALANEEVVLEPGVVAVAVGNYILTDYKNHPEYFHGLNINDVLDKLMSNYPDVYEELLNQ